MYKLHKKRLNHYSLKLFYSILFKTFFSIINNLVVVLKINNLNLKTKQYIYIIHM